MLLADYISHVERSELQGFTPLTKEQFFDLAIRIAGVRALRFPKTSRAL